MKTLGIDHRFGTTVLNMNVSLTLMIGVHPTQFRLYAWTPPEDGTVVMLPSVRGPCDLEGQIVPGFDVNPRGSRPQLVLQRAERGSLVDTTI